MTLCVHQALWLVSQGVFILAVFMMIRLRNVRNARKLMPVIILMFVTPLVLPWSMPLSHIRELMSLSTFYLFKFAYRAISWLFYLLFFPALTFLRYGTRFLRFTTWILFLMSGVFAYNAPEDYGPSGPVIGIDLGTTYSCVGIYRHDRVEIIANSQGARTTPSWVSFRNSEQIVGESAKHAFHAYPSQTVYSVKRLMGRTFDDPELQSDISRVTYEVVNDTGRPAIKIQKQGAYHYFAPEEVSAIILRTMKETAEAYLGTKVTRAVVTVPAYFSDAQRQATKDAGRIAGLEVLRILNEPTAAAIAYGLNQKRSETSQVLVYDLGGGTFDVSILQIQGEIFKVLATAGNARLGGEDFDNRIVEYFATLYQCKFGADVTQNHRSMSKLKKEAERTKRLLSTAMSAELEIESFYRGRDFSATLSRAKFEQLNTGLFHRTLVLVKRALADAKLTTKDVDEIVLVGGSTRIPRVHEMLKDLFGGKVPSQGINPDEAVAIGAAISGGMLSGQGSLSSVKFHNVCPFTIGIETSGGIFTPFIHRNSPVPIAHTQMVSTLEDDQSTVLIQIFEGENTMTIQNALIGEFEMSGIPLAARGAIQVEIKFELDVNGILFVGAKEKLSGASKSITISNRHSGLTHEEVDDLVSKSARYFGDDDLDTFMASDHAVAYKDSLSDDDNMDDAGDESHGTEMVSLESTTDKVAGLDWDV